MLNLPVKILQTIQIETAQATITFDNITNLVAEWDATKKVTSRHLVVIVNAASPDAVAKRAIEIQLNGDAGANYNHQWISGEAAVTDADRREGVNYLFELVGTDYAFAIPGTTYANAFGGGIILFPHAFNTVNHKAVFALGGAVEDYVSAVAGRWASTNAITSLVLSLDTGNFAIGSTFHLGVIDERYLVEEVLLVADGQPTFGNIPQGEGDLAVIGYARSDRAAVEDEVLHSINDDAIVGNYPAREHTGRAGVTAAGPVNGECAMVSGDNATANAFGALIIHYAQFISWNHPLFLTVSGYHETGGPTSEVRLMAGNRNNIEPINKLHYEPNGGTDFRAGSLFSLYRTPKRIIQRQILTASQVWVTFDNIPQNFEALALYIYGRSSRAAASDSIVVMLNNDAVDANYDVQHLYGSGAASGAFRSLASRNWGEITASASPASDFGGAISLFPAYAETDRHKHYIYLCGRDDQTIWLGSHRWENTNAITRIDIRVLNGSFLPGSVFELEGILRREGLPAIEGMQWGV